MWWLIRYGLFSNEFLDYLVITSIVGGGGWALIYMRQMLINFAVFVGIIFLAGGYIYMDITGQIPDNMSKYIKINHIVNSDGSLPWKLNRENELTYTVYNSSNVPLLLQRIEYNAYDCPKQDSQVSSCSRVDTVNTEDFTNSSDYTQTGIKLEPHQTITRTMKLDPVFSEIFHYEHDEIEPYAVEILQKKH